MDKNSQPPPRRPQVAVGAVLTDHERRVLLIQRGQAPNQGKWTLPGGRVEWGESLEEALHRELQEELGIDVCVSCLAPFNFASHSYETFHLLMPLYACRKWQGTVRSLEGQQLTWVAPNRLRDTKPPAQRDAVWVADITYVPTLAGFLYLAVVLDVFSRRIVGWAMAAHLRTELVLAALDMALARCRPAPGRAGSRGAADGGRRSGRGRRRRRRSCTWSAGSPRSRRSRRRALRGRSRPVTVPSAPRCCGWRDRGTTQPSRTNRRGGAPRQRPDRLECWRFRRSTPTTSWRSPTVGGADSPTRRREPRHLRHGRSTTPTATLHPARRRPPPGAMLPQPSPCWAVVRPPGAHRFPECWRDRATGR